MIRLVAVLWMLGAVGALTGNLALQVTFLALTALLVWMLGFRKES